MKCLKKDIYIDDFMIYKKSGLWYRIVTFENSTDTLIIKNNQRILIN